MQKYLVELKARSTDHARQRDLLRSAGAEFRGTDHQIDHYFRVPEGRLKLRSGKLERSLIFYRRADRAAAKDSRVNLTRLPDRETADSVATTLSAALGNWVTVDKRREIYFVGNVKFHLDTVEGLGTFVEIEAIGDTADEHDRLSEQCAHYRVYLGILDEDLVDVSYSDLLSR